MGNTTINNSHLEKHLDNFSEKDRLCGFINVKLNKIINVTKQN